MARPRITETRITNRWPESILSELEALAFVETKGNVSAVLRGIVADWLLKNAELVALAKMKLAEKKGVLNKNKLDPETYLTRKVIG